MVSRHRFDGLTFLVMIVVKILMLFSVRYFEYTRFCRAPITRVSIAEPRCEGSHLFLDLVIVLSVREVAFKTGRSILDLWKTWEREINLSQLSRRQRTDAVNVATVRPYGVDNFEFLLRFSRGKRYQQ